MALPGQGSPCIAMILLLLSVVAASAARVGDKVLAAAALANTDGSGRLAGSSTTPQLLVADLTVTASSSNGAAEVEIAATLSSGYKPATFTLEATDHLPGSTDASSARRFSLGESGEPARVLRSPQLPQQQQGVTKELSSYPPTATSTVSTHDGSGAAVPAGSTGSIVSSSTSTSTGSGTQSQPQGSSNPSSLTSGSTIVSTNPNSSSSGDIQVLAQSSKQVINIIADSSSSSSSSSAGASSSNTHHDIINVLALDTQQAPNPDQPTAAQQEVVGYRGPDWACIKKPGCKPSQQQFGSGGLFSLLPGGSGECEFFGGCDAVKAQGACRASWMWEVDAELGAVVQWCGEQCACPGEAS